MQGRRGVAVPVVGRHQPAAPAPSGAGPRRCHRRRRARRGSSPARSWPCGRRPRDRRSYRTPAAAQRERRRHAPRRRHHRAGDAGRRRLPRRRHRGVGRRDAGRHRHRRPAAGRPRHRQPSQANLHKQQAALDQANLTLQKALAGQSVRRPGGHDPIVRDDRAASTATLYGGLSAGRRPDDIAAAQQAVLAAQQQVDAARSHASAALASATNVCAAIGVDPADPSRRRRRRSTPARRRSRTWRPPRRRSTTPRRRWPRRRPPSTTCSTSWPTSRRPPPRPSRPRRPPAPPPPRRRPRRRRPRTAPARRPPGDRPPPSRSRPRPDPPGGAVVRRPPDLGPVRHHDDHDAGRRCRHAAAPARTGGGSGRRQRQPLERRRSSASAAKPSAADLVAYQSAVDAATANVTMAQQALAQATVVSPIDGTVVAVNLAAGRRRRRPARRPRPSSCQGAGGFEATTTVSLDDVPNVKVGQAATVTADGATTPVDGQGRVDLGRAGQLDARRTTAS